MISISIINLSFRWMLLVVDDYRGENSSKLKNLPRRRAEARANRLSALLPVLIARRASAVLNLSIGS